MPSAKITSVNDTSHFNKLLAASSYTIVDFYADWCGPCKMIAPVFDKLAEEHSKPGRVQFCKVDVDACQDVARKFGVSAYVNPLSCAVYLLYSFKDILSSGKTANKYAACQPSSS